MVEQQDSQGQFILSDMATRASELEERINSVKERLVLFGKNLIDTRANLDEKLKKIEKDNAQNQQELKKISNDTKTLTQEIPSFVRKEEIILVERMLKDFQPLEFVRRKDVEEMIQEHLNKKEDKNAKDKN